MIIDGKTIQQQIVKELLPRVQERSRKPMLGIVVVGDDPVSLRYTTMKQACASTLGVVVTVVRHEVTISQEAFLQEVSALCNTVDGIVVQLPLPKHIDQEKVLALIPWHKDVDVLSPQARERYINGTLPIVPPVVGAIIEVLTRYAIPLEIAARGRDLITGLPREVIITDSDVREAISHSIERLVEATKEVLEVTPPEILSDIMHRGIYICGGGALIKGFAEVLHEEVKMPVYIADNPLTCVVRGTGIILEKFDEFKDILISDENDVHPKVQ
jgi:hypothetical protein